MIGRLAQLPRRVRSTGALSGSLVATAVIVALNAASGVVLARALGPHDRGVLAAAMIVPGLLFAVGSLGVADALAFHVAHQPALLPRLVASAGGIASVQIVVLTCVGFAVVPPLVGHDGPQAVRAGLVYLFYIPLGLCSTYCAAILAGRQRFLAFQVIRVLGSGAPAAAILVLALLGAATVMRAVGVSLAAEATVSVLGALIVARLPLDGLRPDRRVARMLIGYGARAHLANVPIVMNERLDQMLIAVFLSPSQLALYVTAVSVSSPASVVGSSAALVTTPSVAAAAHGVERGHIIGRAIRVSLAASLAVALPLILFAGPLIRGVYGSAFAGSRGPAQILLIAAVAVSGARLLEGVLKGLNRPLDAGIAELVALGVTIIALAALLPTLGLVGAALASLAAYAVSACWALWRVRRSTSPSPRAPGPLARVPLTGSATAAPE